MMNSSDCRVFHISLLAVVAAVFIWSLPGCADTITWAMEAAPVVIAVLILIPLYKRFKFTNLAYLLIAFHCVILLVGAHYTYAEVPLFNWIRDHFGLTRNHYDRLGHFVQGFVPAILAREVLIRNRVVNGRAWLFFLVICITLAISSAYELLEWASAVVNAQAAEAFLGTQGDEWDTQKDMFMCLIGSAVALVTLGHLHDCSLKKFIPSGAGDD